MKVENQQELEKLIKMLRKTGVKTLKTGQIELELSPDEPQSNYKKKQSGSETVDAEISPAEQHARQMELLFWSSTPPGVDDPKGT